MKKIIAALIATLACHLAFAVNEPLPPGTALLDLPKGAKVILKRTMNLREPGGTTSFQTRIGEQSTFFTVRDPVSIPAGETFEIKTVAAFLGGYNLRLAEACSILFLPPEASTATRTVGDFNRVFSGSLAIVWDDPDVDPYPGLPDDVKQDLLMTKILASIKADKYEEALPDFGRLEKLNVKQPESFYYYYIVALDKSSSHTAAKSRGAEFLKTYGKKSKYYNEVLGIVAK